MNLNLNIIVKKIEGKDLRMKYYEKVVSNKELLKAFLTEINLELRDVEPIKSLKNDGVYIFCKYSIDSEMNDIIKIFFSACNPLYMPNECIVLLSDDHCLISKMSEEELIDESDKWLKFLNDTFRHKKDKNKVSNIEGDGKSF